MFKYGFTAVSGNAKTGPIAVSLTSKDSCPDTCQLKGNGCYAEFSYTNIHWNRVTRDGFSLDVLIEKLQSLPIKSKFRHNISGDLPHSDGLIDQESLSKIASVVQNRKLQAFAYTHHDVSIEENRQAIRDAVDCGFTINLSADSPSMADKYAALGIAPVVTLLEESAVNGPAILSTPEGRPIVVCPASRIDGVTCAQCMLCANKNRKSIVGFPAHGIAKNKVIKIVRSQANV